MWWEFEGAVSTGGSLHLRYVSFVVVYAVECTAGQKEEREEEFERRVRKER